MPVSRTCEEPMGAKIRPEGRLVPSAGIFRMFLLFSILMARCIQAFEPQGSVEELYKLEYLPLLRPGVTCRMFSSYDRSGGNDDGFLGTYSKLRVENGNSVIAEMDGPGCIQRIWFTHSVMDRDGLLNFKSEHIQIFVDRSDKPAVDVPLEELFSGELEQFPKPLVGSSLGGFYCYVPIPYRNGCKIVIEGTGVRFYQVTYNEFPSPDAIKSFSMEMTPEYKQSLSEAVKVWSSPGEFTSLNVHNGVKLHYELALKKKKSKTISLPKGPHMVRAVFLKVNEDGIENALKGRISLTWDKAKTPAVDVPIAFLFGQAFDPQPYRSLLAGNCADGYYNFMPMPYLRSARIKITAEDTFAGFLTVIVQPVDLRAEQFGYFHANYGQELPTEEGMYYTLLNTPSRGHYLGTYLVTDGKSDEPVWLEGDESFVVDDELVIHGTGTEDYFNCGWYAAKNRLDKPGSLAVHGFPVYGATNGLMRAVAYRWHITDAVPYQNSIYAKLEHGASNDRSADYRSATFFYDINRSKITSRVVIPVGDECIDYLRQRIWQLSLGDMDYALEKINTLYAHADRAENKILLKGLKAYLNGVQKPTTRSLRKLDKSLKKLEAQIKSMPEQDLYEKPKIEMPTDSDNLIPRPIINAQMILQRAHNDLARRVALQRGFKPGDEIVIEARDPWGELMPEPCYKETEDFTNSYAKADDVHLIGKGARFTYGKTDLSWARFTPDFPEAGYYEVLVIFSYGANAGNTRYVITHADGVTTLTLQQRGRPGTPGRNNQKWLSLGEYRFAQGCAPEQGSVTLYASPETVKPNNEFEYRAYADSVRFVYKGAPK
jgi:hypothetical protein